MDTQAGKTKVIILTAHYRIFGEIAHFSDARLTDYMLEAKDFVAVTNAEVMDHNGRKILTTSFMNVQRDQIEIITPKELAKLD